MLLWHATDNNENVCATVSDRSTQHLKQYNLTEKKVSYEIIKKLTNVQRQGFPLPADWIVHVI
jgi:hypothetical protein